MTAPAPRRCSCGWRCGWRRCSSPAPWRWRRLLVWRAYDTADSLNERELSQRADDLARYVTSDGGEARLVLPSTLRDAYADPARGDIFAIRDAKGRIVAASPPVFGQMVQRWGRPARMPPTCASPASATAAPTITGSA